MRIPRQAARRRLRTRWTALTPISLALALVAGSLSGPAAATPVDDSGLALSVADGTTLSGITTVSATDARSAERPSLSLDGAPQDTTPRDAEVMIAFEGHGYLATTKNTIVINGEHQIVPATAYSGYATGRFAVPAAALRAGENTVTFYTGSAEMMNDPATDGRNDDFNIRNLRLEFSDGSRATDPAMAPTTIANLGDNGSNVRSWTWRIDVPAERLLAGSSFDWDTTQVSSGSEHTLTATSADGERSTSVRVLVDNAEAPTLDLGDGDLVHGTRTLTATTDVDPAIVVDGRPLAVRHNSRVVNPVFEFEADGFQPDNVMDSIWVNGELFRVLGVADAAHRYETVAVEIPWGLLEPGANTIRIRAGGDLSPTPETGVDGFTTRGSRLELSGDRVLRDPAHAPDDVLNYGNATPFHDFTFTVPRAWESVHQAAWDTTQVPDGEHTVTVTRPDGRDTLSRRIVVDNSGPGIGIASPTDGASFEKAGFTVDVAATDAHEIASLALDIDGEPVTQGQELGADDLPSGEHVLTATALDELGNKTVSTAGFRTVGNRPDAPARPAPSHGATEQSPRATQLSARVDDPAGDELDVTFKRGYHADASVGTVTAVQGASTTAVPTTEAGTAVGDAGHAALAAADGDVLTTRGEAAYPFQRFDIDVPATATGHYEVRWTGSVPATQRAALSVWNHATRTWQLLAEGQGTSDGQSLDLVGTASVTDTVRRGKARVLVQDVAASVIAEGGDDAVWAWLSDTQFYAESEPETYHDQTRWVLDNWESEGLGYAIHTGDIVNSSTEAQWRVADEAHRPWDEAGIPYGVLVGNHDIDFADGTYTGFKRWFGAQRYAGKPWYGGSKEDNVQHYDVLSTPEADYLVVFVDWNLDQSEIDWANDVIRAHPDHNVIVATHQYFNNQGGYINPAPRIVEQIVAPNPNIDVILSGHVGIWTDVKNIGGHDVIEVMADYQSTNLGDGWMRTVTFDAEAQTFSNRTFSVKHDRTWWVDDAMENFTVPITLEAPERSVATDYIGVTGRTTETLASFKDVDAGSTVTARARHLEPGTRYSWFATATDAEGHTATSPVWDFTTGQELKHLRSTPRPTVSGIPKVGRELTARTGTWQPAPVTLTRQWLRDGHPIDGATGPRYRLTRADAGAHVSVQVTGSKPGYEPVSKTSPGTRIKR